jgi:hypothetical protein
MYLYTRELKRDNKKDLQRFKESMVAAHPESTDKIIAHFEDVEEGIALEPPRKDLLEGAPLNIGELDFIQQMIAEEGLATLDD